MRKIFILLASILVLSSSLCYARTPDEAMVLLLQTNTKYDLQTFLDKIDKKENFVVSLFVDSGFDVNATTKLDNTPLKISIISNNMDALKLLLDSPKINIDQQDQSGRTPMDIAMLIGNKEAAKLLEEKGAKNNLQNHQTRLNEHQIKAAKIDGEKVLGDKQDFAYESGDTDKTHSGGFFGGDIQTAGRAYWVPPYCNIINYVINTEKKLEPLNDGEILEKANTYQALILFSFTNYNPQEFGDLVIYGIQNGKKILPRNIDSVPLQVTTETSLFSYVTWARIGFKVNFYAADIKDGVPMQIKASSKASKELTFSFSNNHEYNYFNTKTDRFKW